MTPSVPPGRNFDQESSRSQTRSGDRLKVSEYGRIEVLYLPHCHPVNSVHRIHLSRLFIGYYRIYPRRTLRYAPLLSASDGPYLMPTRFVFGS